jgi:hypothetical protein
LNDSEIKNLTLGVDLNLTSTNSSIQHVLQSILVSDKFINDTILNENNSLQARFDTTNSIINDFKNNITVLDTYTNDTVNTIDKIITNVNTNLSTANSVIGEIKTIDSTNFTALNSTVKNNYLKLISSQNFINSTILAANNNITLFYKYQNDLINTTTDNIEVAQTFTNDTVNYIRSLEAKINQNLSLADSTINEVKFIASQNFTALNSTIGINFFKVLSNQNFFNTTLIAENNNVTLFWKYENSLVNKTSSSVQLTESIINSTAHEVNTNLTFDYLTLSDLIGVNNFNLNEDIIFSKNSVLTDNLIYKTDLAIQDYVDSHGTGIITTSDGTSVPAYTNILDPFEVNQITTESGITTNKTTIWYGNPINTSYTNVVVSDSPSLEFQFNGVYNGSLVVNYYNDTLGLKLVSSQTEAVYGTYAFVPLNKKYLVDGYMVGVVLNYSASKATNVTIQSEIQWSGEIPFVWNFDNSSDVYSSVVVVPGDAGYYGTINLGTLHGAFMNTTYQVQTVTVGFPSNVVASTSSIKVVDLTNGYTLGIGSNFQGSTNGVAFTQNNWNATKYQISFSPQVLTVNNQVINIQMRTGSSTVINGATYYTASGTYVNELDKNVSANLYLALPSTPSSNQLIVVVNGKTVSSSDVAVSGTQVIVSGFTLTPNEQISVTVYYQQISPLSSFNFLFKTLVPGTIISFWLVILIISMIVLIFPLHALKYIRSRSKKNYKMVVILGVYSLFFLGWVLLLLFYLANLL